MPSQVKTGSADSREMMRPLYIKSVYPELKTYAIISQEEATALVGQSWEAGAAKAQLLVSATNVDEINLLTALVGKGVGAKKTVVRVHHRERRAPHRV